jgi:hypothetical protein
MASQRHSVVWEYGQRRKITPVARGLSGGTNSLRWHGETLSARKHSGGLRFLRWLEVTPVPCSYSRATDSLRWHEMTSRAKDHSYGLEARACFDGLG